MNMRVLFIVVVAVVACHSNHRHTSSNLPVEIATPPVTKIPTTCDSIAWYVAQQEWCYLLEKKAFESKDYLENLSINKYHIKKYENCLNAKDSNFIKILLGNLLYRWQNEFYEYKITFTYPLVRKIPKVDGGCQVLYIRFSHEGFVESFFVGGNKT